MFFRTNLNLKHYGSKGFQSIDRKQCLCRKLTCINTFPVCPFLRMCASQIILSFAILFSFTHAYVRQTKLENNIYLKITLILIYNTSWTN